MKNLKFAVVLILAFISIEALAQRKEVTELMSKAQFNEVKKNLDLNEHLTSKLEPIYMEYLKEMNKNRAGKQSPFGAMGRESRSYEKVEIDDETADAIITERIEQAKHLALTKEKYYKLFKTVLTPKQIMVLFDTEKELMRKVRMELQRRNMKSNMMNR